jgi:hypothetical protein
VSVSLCVCVRCGLLLFFFSFICLCLCGFFCFLSANERTNNKNDSGCLGVVLRRVERASFLNLQLFFLFSLPRSLSRVCRSPRASLASAPLCRTVHKRSLTPLLPLCPLFVIFIVSIFKSVLLFLLCLQIPSAAVLHENMCMRMSLCVCVCVCMCEGQTTCVVITAFH